MTTLGFVKANSDNLSHVDIFMITQFLKESECFNMAELRGAKAASSVRESYGDQAIGYVELKREANICNIKAKICPEHKIRSKNYSVQIIIDEGQEVVQNVVCHDCAASAGGCKHALAFLMWVHRRSEDPSPTEITSYWQKPLLSGVGTTIKFVEVKEFSASTSEAPNIASGSIDDKLCLEKLLHEGKRQQIDCHITRYTNEVNTKYDNLSMYKLMLKFKDCGNTYEEFITFASALMEEKLCNEAETESRMQNKCSLWYELRFGRITASKIHEVSRCKTSDGVLVETIIGAHKAKPTQAMKRGNNLESSVLQIVGEKLKTKFRNCGFIVRPEYPIFGASPDGVTENYVVEVKCPVSEKTKKNYIKNGEITEKFKAQLHLQMLAAKKIRVCFV